MTTSFRIAEHSVTSGVRVVEVLQDGNVVGVIYPDDSGISIVSAHISEKEIPPDFDGEVIDDNGQGRFLPIPSIKVKFKPRRYFIINNRIVYAE